MGFFDLFKDIKVSDVIDTGIKFASAYNKSKARDDYANLLREQEDRNYNEQRANYDAYVQYLMNRAGGGGGGPSASTGMGHLTGALAANTKMYQPALNAYKWLIPYQTKQYRKGMKGINALRAYLEQPQFKDLMKAPTTPTLQFDIGELPEHMKGKK